MAQLSLDVDWSVIAKLREDELEEARALQLALLPEAPLRADQVEVASRVRPTACVGGDFLDYFCLSDASVGLYVGDVVGKGLSAALYAALAVGTLRGIQKTGQRPGAVLELLNKRLRTRVLRCMTPSAAFCASPTPAFQGRYTCLRMAATSCAREVCPQGCSTARPTLSNACSYSPATRSFFSPTA